MEMTFGAAYGRCRAPYVIANPAPLSDPQVLDALQQLKSQNRRAITIPLSSVKALPRKRDVKLSHLPPAGSTFRPFMGIVSCLDV